LSEDEESLRRKAYVLEQLSSRVLLSNMMIERERTPGYKYFKIGVASKMLDGAECDLSSFDAEAQLIEHELTSDPKIVARLTELRTMGFEVYFGIYDEPWRRALEINIIQNSDANRLLSAEVGNTS